MKIYKYTFFLFISVSIAGCNTNSTELQPDKTDEILNKSSVFSDEKEKPAAVLTEASGVHKIEVVEILPTEKYLYLKVTELGSEYWIATLKQAGIEKGGTYFFTGGLLKKNFESKEYNRVFDEIYLVDNFVTEAHGLGMENQTIELEQTSGTTETEKRTDGTVSIAELVKSPNLYAGKKVKIRGNCAKVNNNIMGTNWVHINDGSNNGYDFLATTSANILVGDEVILEGTLAVDKNFGAGYLYPVILENCELLKP